MARLYLGRAMDYYRRCIALDDEVSCAAYLSRSYGRWIVEIGDDEVAAVMDEVNSKCSPMEYSFMYCILCVGVQCHLQPSESMIRHVESCLGRLSMRSELRESLLYMLRKAMEIESEISCT
jgi:hypothetical protein